MVHSPFAADSNIDGRYVASEDVEYLISVAGRWIVWEKQFYLLMSANVQAGLPVVSGEEIDKDASQKKLGKRKRGGPLLDVPGTSGGLVSRSKTKIQR